MATPLLRMRMRMPHDACTCTAHVQHVYVHVHVHVYVHVYVHVSFNDPFHARHVACMHAPLGHGYGCSVGTPMVAGGATGLGGDAPRAPVPAARHPAGAAP